jgi:glycosyl transferase family 87
VIARSERSYPRADPLRVGAAAAGGIALFSLAWALLHTGFYDDAAIVDTPVYQGYGDAMEAGRVPYRDFELEYPPGALPVFLLPSLAGGSEDYVAVFEALMLACGAAAVAFVPVALAAAGAAGRTIVAGTAAAALAPLLLGPLILSRFDLWPAALASVTLAALAAGRDRIGLGFLGAAVAAKLYPLVLVPLALLYVARRRGSREALACLGAFALVLLAIVGPFLLASPDGLVESVTRQTGRPLQIESLGAGVLLAADRLGLYEASVVSSHGSQNLAGPLPDALASVHTVVQALAVAAVWIAFARSQRTAAGLLVAAAAAVAAFVAFGKVLSPQFLVWLLPLVPLAFAGAGFATAVLFAGVLAVTHLWFPSRYWDIVALEPVAWLVVCRDVLLVALAVALVAAIRPRLEASRSA